jgi:hypothetical protein
MSDVGLTGSGKTSRAIKMVFCNEIDCPKEVETWNLPPKDHDAVIEGMVRAYKTRWLLPVKELFVIGTEKSTIHFMEIYVRAKKDKGLESGVDGIESIKKFNEVMIDLECNIDEERKNDIGLVLDTGSSVLGWCNEVIRRNVMGIPKLAKGQGAPAHFWYWRNMKMESLALNMRDFNVPVWQTWQFKKDQDGKYTSDPFWHDKSGQLSSMWMNTYNLVENGYNTFYSIVMKNRKNNNIVGSVYPMITPNMILACAIGLGDHLKSILKVNKDIVNKVSYIANT